VRRAAMVNIIYPTSILNGEAPTSGPAQRRKDRDGDDRFPGPNGTFRKLMR